MRIEGALTYADVCRPSTTATRWAYEILLVLTGTILLALSAKVQIPMWPVPVTAQTFAVLLVGALFGAKRGTATVLVYISEGALGLPVFAGPVAGLAYMSGPTGGYLIGFIAAAWIVGRLAERGWDRRFVTTVAAMALGTAAIFVCGMGRLAALGGPIYAVVEGLVPFIPGAIVKIVLAAALLPSGWKVLAKLQAGGR
ncbi:MAG: biotin transporter BioY [Planctomycetes bacterium]|nr:biotin transporter BioY [Planctomycetota bacterium]